MRQSVGVALSAAAVVAAFAAGWMASGGKAAGDAGARPAAVAPPPVTRELPPGASKPHLERLAPYIGEWQSVGTMAGRSDYVVDRSFAWTLNDQFIEMRTDFYIAEIKVEERAMIGWDQEAETLRLFGFGSAGDHYITERVLLRNDGGIVFETRLVGGGAPGQYRITLTGVKDDAFTTIVELKESGLWTPQVEFAYRRK